MSDQPDIYILLTDQLQFIATYTRTLQMHISLWTDHTAEQTKQDHFTIYIKKKHKYKFLIFKLL